jgi:hypothetical protein
LDSAGDFREFSAQKFEHQSLETIGDEKSPHLPGLSHQRKKNLRKQECLAEEREDSILDMEIRRSRLPERSGRTSFR